MRPFEIICILYDLSPRFRHQKSTDFAEVCRFYFFTLHFGELTALCKALPRFDTAMENLIFLH